MSIQFKLSDSDLEKAYDKLVEHYIQRVKTEPKHPELPPIPYDQYHYLREINVADEYLAKEGEP